MPELSDLVGIPKDRIYKWEKGTTPYITSEVEKLMALIENGTIPQSKNLNEKINLIPYFPDINASAGLDFLTDNSNQRKELNDAIKIGGFIKQNPFKEFDRGKYKHGKRNFLEIVDCDKIHELMTKEIPDLLRVIAAYYLFMCYTGLRFTDATKQFKPTIHILNDERIIINTGKFNEDVNLLIHNRLRAVLSIVINNPLKITNKDFNKYLKVVATMCSIEINLTAHVGRHTFGATLAEMDVPIERAQKLLGHRDKKSTEIYYHIKNKVLDQEMAKWNDFELVQQKTSSVETPEEKMKTMPN